MKTHRFLAIGLAFVGVTAVQAQQNKTSDSKVANQPVSNSVLDFEKIAKNYLRCLCSDNPGVVESALGHVTYMRIAYPKLDLTEIQERIFQLSMTGSTRSIRTKAFLAVEIFANPSAFQHAIASRKASGDGLFEDIGWQMMP